MSNDIEKVTIIGAGPAGLAVSLQLRRYGITPHLLERACTGGLLRNADLVANYPGFPAGVSGLELVRLFGEQARLASVEVTQGEVVELTRRSGLFHVRTRQGLHVSRVVVIASGTSPITFSDDQVQPEALGLIYYEVDPLREIVGRSIAVVGAGDAAFDYALSLAKRNHVTILNRTGRIKCLELLWKRAIASPSIAYLTNTEIFRIRRESDDLLALECTAPSGSIRICAHYLVGALGREPELGFVAPSLREQFAQLQNDGFLHVIGDARNGVFRQTAIAVGDGVLAGMQIHKQLEEAQS